MSRALNVVAAAARARRARVDGGDPPSLFDVMLDDVVVREVARGLDREEVVRGVVRGPRARRRHARAAAIAACECEKRALASAGARRRQRGHAPSHWRHLYQKPVLSTLPQKWHAELGGGRRRSGVEMEVGGARRA